MSHTSELHRLSGSLREEAQKNTKTALRTERQRLESANSCKETVVVPFPIQMVCAEKSKDTENPMFNSHQQEWESRGIWI